MTYSNLNIRFDNKFREIQMTVEGKIVEIFDTKEIKESFKKREFVLEYAENTQYPEVLKFELIQSNCEQMDNVNTGDVVIVSFNLKGRKWTDPNGEIKYFNSLQAWKIERKGSSAPTANEDTGLRQEDFSQDDTLPF